MLSEKDKSVVAQMCRTGMALEVLKKSFPQFDAADVEEVFNEEKMENSEEDFKVNISCNCS